MPYILALDAGTTSVRAIVFDHDGAVRAPSRRRKSARSIPQPGWVEHDPQEIWSTQIAVAVEALAQRADSSRATSPPSASPTSARPPSSGIARPASPICNAIVWQDRRTAAVLRRTPRRGPRPAHPAAHRPAARRLLFRAPRSPGFSTTCPARAPGPRPASSPSAPSTPGSSGSSPAAASTSPTRPTPRARCSSTSTPARGTTNCCKLFRIPASLLPEVRSSSEVYRRGEHVARPQRRPDRRHRGRSAGGALRPDVLRARPRQEHLRHRLLHAAEHRHEARRLEAPAAHHRRLAARRRSSSMRSKAASSSAARSCSGCATGSGSSAPPRRSTRSPRPCPTAAASYLVPAFAGLGAPHWDRLRPRRRSLGLTRGTTAAHIARAALEGIAFQVADLLDAMQRRHRQAARRNCASMAAPAAANC